MRPGSVLRWGGLLASLAIAARLGAAPPELSHREVRILSPVVTRRPDGGSRSPDIWIILHGRGGNARNMAQLWDLLEDPKPVGIFPEGPYALPPSEGGPGWSWGPSSNDAALWARADAQVVEELLDLIRRTRLQHGGGRVFVLGFSQGASYASLVAARDPALVSGLIAYAGSLPLEHLPATDPGRPETRLRVFLAHGRKDGVIPFAESLKAQNDLERGGHSVTVCAFAGGHTLDAEVLRRAQAWTRNPAP